MEACSNPATEAVEGYSARDGLTHGTLAVVMLTCSEHVSAARQKWTDEGLAPHAARGPAGDVLKCGHVMDFRKSSALTH